MESSSQTNINTIQTNSSKKNKFAFGLVGIVILIGLTAFLIKDSNNIKNELIITEKDNNQSVESNNQDNDQYSADPFNATYMVDNQEISFTEGVATIDIPNSEQSIIYKIWGMPAYGSLNNSSNKDAGLIIEQTGSGSGVFYYVSASMNYDQGYKGTNSILLGDRVAIQNIGITDSKSILVNYADRMPNEPMTTSPSLGVSKYFEVEDDILSEIN